MSIPFWIAPTISTLTIFAWAVFTPLPRAQGDYDFTGMFTFFFRSAVVVIVTLLSWLVYFASHVAVGS